MDQDFLNDLHVHCAQMRHCSAELADLARAFARTGNPSVADQLGVMADDLYEAQDALSRSFGQELARQLDQSQAAFSETISAVFRGLRNHAGTAP